MGQKLNHSKDLSILIPSRNEKFLNHTLRDLYKNIRGDTEIIVVFDGDWPQDSIPDNERLRIIHHSEAKGQRAAINEACRLSKAKYVMKLDAHCAVGEGFDVKMIEAMEDDWTMVPMMYNLHAFDWVCIQCKKRKYQGPTPDQCECGGRFAAEMIWKPKPSPEITAMRFDRDLKFQYWQDYKKRQSGDLVETLSILGACFMLTRERYWDLNICDEGHGGWGQQGTEVALKTWLSGGRLIVNKRTWFAHMFRTQGGDFGFPYPLSKRETEKAREYSRGLFLNKKWGGAKHDLQWVIDRFAPVPEWGENMDEGKLTKGIVYYSGCYSDEKLLEACRKRLEEVAGDMPIVAVTLKPIKWDRAKCIDLDWEPSALTLFQQILAGLEAIDTDVVFMAEDDMIYHPSHFEFIPPDKETYFYNENTWKVDLSSGQSLFYYTKQTSGLCAYRSLLVEHYRKRVAKVKKDGFSRHMGFEPGCHAEPRGVDNFPAKRWMSDVPNIDIRHSNNWTANRWFKEQFRSERSIRGWTKGESVPGWGITKGRIKEIVFKSETPK